MTKSVHYDHELTVSLEENGGGGETSLSCRFISILKILNATEHIDIDYCWI